MRNTILFNAIIFVFALTAHLTTNAQTTSPKPLKEVNVPASVQDAFLKYLEAKYPSYQYYSGGWTKENDVWIADYMITTADLQFCYNNNSVKANGEVKENGGYCVLSYDY